MPSLTMCPAVNRIDRNLLDKYCDVKGIMGQEKVEFHEFIESMANATYETFHQIKDYDSIKVSFYHFLPSSFHTAVKCLFNSRT